MWVEKVWDDGLARAQKNQFGLAFMQRGGSGQCKIMKEGNGLTKTVHTETKH